MILPSGRLRGTGQCSAAVSGDAYRGLFQVLVVCVGFTIRNGLTVGVLIVAGTTEVVGVIFTVECVKVFIAASLQLDIQQVLVNQLKYEMQALSQFYIHILLEWS